MILLLVSNCSKDVQEIEKAFELLTYPQDGWNEQDFGTPTRPSLQALIRQYAPSFWTQPDSCGPMNFYRQYVPLLRASRGGQAHGIVKRSFLKKFERDFSIDYELASSPSCLEDANPPLYAYGWQEEMGLGDGRKVPIQVLKYAFTFYKSGLPAELGTVQGMGLFGSSDHWHYLDIHGAVFYLLDKNHQVFALVLAQHNHFRTFIIGQDIVAGEPIEICFALRSNEPYLCSDRQKRYPTAPTWQAMRFIVTGKEKPLLGAYDLVPGKDTARKISYHLKFLPHRDPLITSWVPLGPEIKIWGLFSTFFRDSPPGMAIYTSPALLPFSKTAQYFYFHPNDEETFTNHETNMGDFFSSRVEPVLSINRRRFVAGLQKSGFFLETNKD